jgi:hypothetical protein
VFVKPLQISDVTGPMTTREYYVLIFYACKFCVLSFRSTTLIDLCTFPEMLFIILTRKGVRRGKYFLVP